MEPISFSEKQKNRFLDGKQIMTAECDEKQRD